MFPQKLITCIFPKGMAHDMAERLKGEHGLMTSDIKTARGVGKITPLAYRGLGAQSEKEILTVVVPADTANEIFDYLYHEAQVNRPHGGIMYIYELNQATRFELPSIPEED
ncbi:MAG: hypothetical protein HKN08_01025 [Gammaproteobacteria bacterium]|nr:hypothetical protein [Gammaproteobacteria bacterium]